MVDFSLFIVPFRLTEFRQFYTIIVTSFANRKEYVSATIRRQDFEGR